MIPIPRFFARTLGTDKRISWTRVRAVTVRAVTDGNDPHDSSGVVATIRGKVLRDPWGRRVGFGETDSGKPMPFDHTWFLGRVSSVPTRLHTWQGSKRSLGSTRWFWGTDSGKPMPFDHTWFLGCVWSVPTRYVYLACTAISNTGTRDIISALHHVGSGLGGCSQSHQSSWQ